jgi:hypothetical protein
MTKYRKHRTFSAPDSNPWLALFSYSCIAVDMSQVAINQQSVILTHPGCRLGAALVFQLPCQLLRMPGALCPPLLILLQVLGPLYSVLAITKLVFGGWILPVHACRTVMLHVHSFHHWKHVFPQGQVHTVLSSSLTHLHNVETRVYCPQFLSLDSQCRDDVSESKWTFRP